MFLHKSTSIPLENSAIHRIIGQRTISFDFIDSTNDFAIRWLTKSKPIEGTVITADFQSKGKGQIGRTWFGTPGANLAYTTLLYPTHLHAREAPLALMCLSSAVCEAVSQLFDLPALKLKWPNDLYWNNEKLGGMLIQTALFTQKIQHLVFGLGLNVNETHFPAELPNPVSLRQITGREINRDLIVPAINAALDSARLKLLKQDNTRIVEKYNALLYANGEVRTFLNLSTRDTFNARVCGVDSAGSLLLDHSGRRSQFQMHEVKWM